MVNHFKGKYHSKDWLPRTEHAAKIINTITNIEHVYDFGCGDALLAPLLHNQYYYGYDANKLHDYISICDFTVEFPRIEYGDKINRICVCLGFFEYFYSTEVEQLLKNISNNFDYLMYSYVNYKKSSMQNSWPRALLCSELVEEINKYYSKNILQCAILKNTTNIYLASK